MKKSHEHDTVSEVGRWARRGRSGLKAALEAEAGVTRRRHVETRARLLPPTVTKNPRSGDGSAGQKLILESASRGGGRAGEGLTGSLKLFLDAVTERPCHWYSLTHSAFFIASGFRNPFIPYLPPTAW